MEEAAGSENSLYLFYKRRVFQYEQGSYVLYKIDTSMTTPYLSPILEIPTRGKPHNGLRCGQLGSKLYFLGGSVNYGSVDAYPKDVYVFDTLTNEFKKMDSSLNGGKPDPCVVFTANGKLYILCSIPAVPPEELPLMKLFECFDPKTGEWHVLHNLPPMEMRRSLGSRRHVPQGIEWIGCTVLEKRQEVVLSGWECTRPKSYKDKGPLVTFIYNLQTDGWARIAVSKQVISFLEEGYDDDYFYGICKVGPPLKSKACFISEDDSINLCHGRAVGDVTLMTIGEKPALENRKWAKWVATSFPQPYLGCGSRLLQYLGNGHFYYIASGMVGDPRTFYDDTVPHDLSTRGITITLFKEVEGNQAEILHSQEYFISTVNGSNIEVYNMKLVDNHLVAPEKKLIKSKGEKKKKKEERAVGIWNYVSGKKIEGLYQVN